MDPLWPYIRLGLRFNTDTGVSDVTGRAVSAFGSAAVSSAESRFGGASLYVPGGAASGVSAPLDLCSAAAGELGLAMWVYPLSIGTVQGLFFCGLSSSNANRLQGVLQSDGTVTFYIEDGSAGSNNATTSAKLVAGAWQHLRFQIRASAMEIYVSGALSASVAKNKSAIARTTTEIGRARQSSAMWSFNGYLDDVVTEFGVARHAANFAVPTATFDYIALNEMQLSGMSAPRGISATPVPAPSMLRVPGISGSRNIYHGGPGAVVGTVERKGSPNAPLARRVRLLRDRDAVMVGETWSNAAGQFAFTYLDSSETYTALAYDHTGEFESVCASRLIAEVA